MNTSIRWPSLSAFRAGRAGTHAASKRIRARRYEVRHAAASSNFNGEMGRRLTRAEGEVLEAALGGGRNREIAGQLFLSEATVRTHLTHIYAKLGVESRASLIATMRDRAQGERREPLASEPGRRRWRLMPLAVVTLAVFLGSAAVGPYLWDNPEGSPEPSSRAPVRQLDESPAVSAEPEELSPGAVSSDSTINSEV